MKPYPKVRKKQKGIICTAEPQKGLRNGDIIYIRKPTSWHTKS